MSCCKPQAKVLSATTGTVGTEAVVILTINRYLYSLNLNCPFKLCIPRNQLLDTALGAADSTLRIFVMHVGGTVRFPVFIGCSGNYLRLDQLRTFLRCHTEGCCPAFDFDAFIGVDPQHVTIHNRFCPSLFSGLPTTTLATASGDTETDSETDNATIVS